jgi:N-acetylmuramoyl-L-alanine amidase
MVMRKITKIYVHALGSSPSEDIGKAEIDKLHKDKGWRCIGYHDVVRRNGLGEKGRPIEEQGAGVKGDNEESIHIAMAGGVKEDGLTIFERVRLKRYGTPDSNFTRSQLDYLKGLLDSYLDEFPEAEVKGHRDAFGVNKACPCFDVGAWYGEPSME